MRTDTLPNWTTGHAADSETTVEVTLILAPHINWDAVEGRYEVHEFISSVVSAFCREHRDTDWRNTDLDYAVTLDTFVLESVKAHQPDWLRDF
jgi:hypothetical protein